PPSPAEIAVSFAKTADPQLLSEADKRVIAAGHELFWPHRLGLRSKPTDLYYGLEKHLFSMLDMTAEEVARDGDAITFSVKITFPKVLADLSSAFTSTSGGEKAEQLANLDRYQSQYG